jgi:hypothetical protein
VAFGAVCVWRGTTVTASIPSFALAAAAALSANDRPPAFDVVPWQTSSLNSLIPKLFSSFAHRESYPKVNGTDLTIGNVVLFLPSSPYNVGRAVAHGVLPLFGILRAGSSNVGRYV